MAQNEGNHYVVSLKYKVGFVEDGYFEADRTSYIVLLHKPTAEQDRAMERSRVKPLFYPIEDHNDTDWESAWNADRLQNFLASFIKEEKEAAEKKKPKPDLYIACEVGVRRSVLFMCCFFIVYRSIKPHKAMLRLAGARQVVEFWKSSLPFLEGLGKARWPEYKLPEGLMKDPVTKNQKVFTLKAGSESKETKESEETEE